MDVSGIGVGQLCTGDPGPWNPAKHYQSPQQLRVWSVSMPLLPQYIYCMSKISCPFFTKLSIEVYKFFPETQCRLYGFPLYCVQCLYGIFSGGGAA